MLGRLWLAGGVALVMLAIMPGINTFLREATDNIIAELPGVTDFELAYWHMVPIVLVVWFVFVVPLHILVSGLRRKGRGRRFDDEG